MLASRIRAAGPTGSPAAVLAAHGRACPFAAHGPRGWIISATVQAARLDLRLAARIG